MKQKLLITILTVIALSLPTQASAQVAAAIAGTYTGKLDVTLIIPDEGELPFETISQDITITAEGDNEMTLEIKDFKFALTPGSELVSIGDIRVSNVPILPEGENKTFTKNEIITIILGDLNAALNGSVNGNDELNLDLYLVLEGAMDIKVKFTDGVKQGTRINSATQNSFYVYPGTTDSQLFISGITENLQYAIYNITGTLLKTGIFTGQPIHVGELNKGVYLIQMMGKTMKFIKK